MKKLFTLLLLFTLTVSAGTRYLIVSGDTAKPIPERLKAKATHTLEMTDEQLKIYVTPDHFKVVDGKPVAKTAEEIEAQILAAKKAQASKEAERISKYLKANPVIQEGTDIYPFTVDSKIMFLAQYQSGSDVRVKRKGKKSEKMTKTKATLLFSKLSIHLNNIEDALEADLEAIETGDFSLTNLKAIEAAQKALR